MKHSLTTTGAYAAIVDLRAATRAAQGPIRQVAHRRRSSVAVPRFPDLGMPLAMTFSRTGLPCGRPRIALPEDLAVKVTTSRERGFTLLEVTVADGETDR